MATATTKIDWYSVLGFGINAVILAGLSFFTTLAGMALTGEGYHPKAAFYAAALAAGVKVFVYLATVRGLTT